MPRDRSKQRAYTDVNTPREVEAETLVYTGLHVSTTAVQQFFRHTDTLPVVEPKTLVNTLADVMTEALIDVLADRQAELAAKILVDLKG